MQKKYSIQIAKIYESVNLLKLQKIYESMNEF